jgi:prepilin-type N-terminal cleavage/methylation domain-containing protein
MLTFAPTIRNLASQVKLFSLSFVCSLCNLKMRNGPVKRGSAFTLVELLVTIAIIAILAGLLLGVIARGKARGREMVCLNNTRQLGIAFGLYHQDYADTFPASGSKNAYGPQPEDWIYWQHGRDINKSSIVPFVSQFNAKLFTCPGDSEALRLQPLGIVPGDPFRYSYSLTSYSLTGEINRGMATLITKERKVYPFKAADIKQPSQKIMLVEEDRNTIDDPRWVPMGLKTNLITARHSGKGFVAFADDHIEKVTPAFGLAPQNNDPTF